MAIPFLPAYTLEQISHRNLTVWWFEQNFSQITYGPSPERGSHACVLIALLTASKLAQQNLKLKRNTRNFAPSHGVVVALAEAILEGVEVAEQKRLTSSNLSVPEAYQALGDAVMMNLHEWVG